MLKKFHQFVNEQTTSLSPEQINLLNECTKGSWSINQQTGLVDIKGDFECSDKKLTDLKGIKFGGVTQNFNCSYNNLTDLIGAPQTVGGNFYCYENNLTSLKGAPTSVSGYFSCSNNKLTSLIGAPQTVGGNFSCSDNNLTSLIGAPTSVSGFFSCSNNKLTSLKGAPTSVSGYFSCSNNDLVSLKGIPITSKDTYIEFNALPTPVLLASLKSPEEYYNELSNAIINNQIDYPRWPMLDLEWISIT